MLLALETATQVGGVALLDGERITGEVVLGERASFNAELLPAVDRVLREAGCPIERVETIALSVGPGSFTGLRIGLATALGLCFGVGRRIVPVPTLAALSLHAHGAARIGVLLDARKGQVYAGLYGPEAEPLQGEVVADPLDWLRALADGPPDAVLGPGAHLYANEVRTVLGPGVPILPVEDGWPRAGTVGRLGARLAARGLARDPAEVELVYLRRAEAEERAAARGSLDTFRANE